ncbi:carbohydrate ABC transporter permease [Kosmotoga pacifica]|uniref:ABC transporter permease n=1 Tax=Kosmotoga pacifica TaxID=1330330 RepID=A0A0G2Z9R7_9BACT|nr:sugar ABC transporter permease [Kosmotoga pacifica]AKI98365.1 ABC transporter permease [Kosmotoga pacifica]
MILRKARVRHLLMFILPAAFLIAVFVLYPTIRTITLSFVGEDGKLTLSNYKEVLTSRDIVDPRGFERGFPFGALIHNLMWIAIHLPLTTFLGLFLAVILRNIKGGAIIRSIIFLGMVMPMIVGGIMVRFMFDANVGVVNMVLGVFGIPIKTWTAYPESSLLALIFGSIWLWTGFSLILYSAGLETIPKSYYEAAQIDGASPVRMFFNITIPLLKPITVVVVTMTLLWELKIFDIVYVATMGGPGGASNVLALQMYMYGFREWNFGKAAVVAVLITLSTLIAAIPMIKSAGDEAE